MDEQDRRVFEAWAERSLYMDKSNERYDENNEFRPREYVCSRKQLSWETWLAALAHRDAQLAAVTQQRDEAVEDYKLASKTLAVWQVRSDRMEQQLNKVVEIIKQHHKMNLALDAPYYANSDLAKKTNKILAYIQLAKSQGEK